MSAKEMLHRAKIVAGEQIEDDETTMMEDDGDFEKLVVSDSEDDDDDDIAKVTDNRRKHVRTLIYNDSDNEEQAPMRSPVKRPQNKSIQKPKKKFNIFDMVKESNAGDTDDDDKQENEFEIDSEDIRDRLAQLDDEDDSENEATKLMEKSTTKANRKRIAIVDSDTDSDDDLSKPMGSTSEQAISGQASEPIENNRQPESEEFTSQNIRRRLAELSDDSGSDNEAAAKKRTKTNGNVQKHKKWNTLIDSDDSENEPANNSSSVERISSNPLNSTTNHLSVAVAAATDVSIDEEEDGSALGNVNDGARKSNNKRERSESEESLSDERNVVSKKKKAKNVPRRNVIDDGDDEE